MKRGRQINLNTTSEFESDLELISKLGLGKTKSEAIRAAVHEVASKARKHATTQDFRSWIGLALRTPLNRKPRFKNEDELWS